MVLFLFFAQKQTVIFWECHDLSPIIRVSNGQNLAKNFGPRVHFEIQTVFLSFFGHRV
jgi:hypothetical protein